MTETLTKEIKGQIFSKAIQDGNFKQALLTDPEGTIKEIFGVDLPQGKTLHVLEQTPENIAFVIPVRPAEITDNMTENEIISRLTRDVPKLSDRMSKIMESYGNILAKVWTDKAFENRFIEDPKGVLSEETSSILGENLVITVKFEDGENEYITIPMVGADTELSEEELELISGGLYIPVVTEIVVVCLLVTALGGWAAW